MPWMELTAQTISPLKMAIGQTIPGRFSSRFRPPSGKYTTWILLVIWFLFDAVDPGKFTHYWSGRGCPSKKAGYWAGKSRKTLTSLVKVLYSSVVATQSMTTYWHFQPYLQLLLRSLRKHQDKVDQINQIEKSNMDQTLSLT